MPALATARLELGAKAAQFADEFPTGRYIILHFCVSSR
jgi:hypothetical protein